MNVTFKKLSLQDSFVKYLFYCSSKTSYWFQHFGYIFKYSLLKKKEWLDSSPYCPTSLGDLLVSSQ